MYNSKGLSLIRRKYINYKKFTLFGFLVILSHGGYAILFSLTIEQKLNIQFGNVLYKSFDFFSVN